MTPCRLVLLVLGLSTVAAGCRLAQRPDLGPPDVEVLPIDAGTEPGSVEQTRSIELQLVADNQFRYTGGEGSPLTMALVDAFVPTANRPAALGLHANAVYAWCLEKGGQKPIVHLGDACDLSCVVEFAYFAELMRETGRPWAMVPGNHDCAYLGSTFDVDWEDGTWARACRGGGGILDKPGLVSLYLAALLDGLADGPHGDELATALGSTREELLRDLPARGRLTPRLVVLARRIRAQAPRGSWACDTPGTFLTGLSWVIDEEKGWRSYIAQRISMTDPAQKAEGGFTGILLDTCQWWHRPELIPINVVPPYEWNPGLAGELLADQLMAIKAWMDEASARGDGITLFAHHPVKEFTPKSRQALKYLWRHHEVILLASGHTHRGYIETHGDLAERALELNVASLTDWPMEWRELRLSRYARGEREFFGVHSPRYTVPDEILRETKNLDDIWAEFEAGAERFLQYRVLDDMALDYSTGLHDLMSSRQWLETLLIGPVVWLFLGKDTVVRDLFEKVIPNIQGIERENLARRRLSIQEALRLWDRFPTTAHADADWRRQEAELRKLAKRALERDSTAEEIREAERGIWRYAEHREVADPEAMRHYRVLLAAWASMYEANRTGRPQVTDDNFRVSRQRERASR